MADAPAEADSDISPNLPTSPPKTAGRKKIKIQRIEDSRNRQVTFLKRKNGLLKKAMELGILCDCEVSVIIFNLNNGKLFEYSSVEPEKVLQKYATYSGPSERRKKEKFFDLAASKGHTNVPLNEPQLAQAAMDAANAAAHRPRPVHKFKNSGTPPMKDQYYNGRKLSSGESPGNPPLPLPVSSMNVLDLQEQLAPSAAGLNRPAPTKPTLMAPLVPTESVPPTRLSQAQITPRFTADVPVPSMYTPHSALRHLSAAFGLPTPMSVRSLEAKQPFGQTTPHIQEPPVSARFAMPPPPSARRSTGAPMKALNSSRPPLAPAKDTTSQPVHNLTKTCSVSAPSPGSSSAKGERTQTTGAQQIKTEVTPKEQKAESPSSGDGVNVQNAVEGKGGSDSDLKANPPTSSESGDSKTKSKPNLTVLIPHPNREDQVQETQVGLNLSSSPGSRNEPLPSLGTARFPSMSPTAHGTWAPWHHLASAQTEQGHIPLTPFLNMDTFGMTPEGSHFGLGVGPHLSLPSPTNAGLIPLTPRILGFDPLLSARTDGPPTLTGGNKRPFDLSSEDKVDQNRKRR